MLRSDTIDGRTHTWSDLGMMIRQVETGVLYEDATDVPGKYSYEETDIPIVDEDIEDSEALRLITGVET